MLAALIGLTRPLNCVITVISVAVGALAAGVDARALPIVLAALSAALVAAAGNCHNDLIDLKIDRINRPRRPLPSGRMSPMAAGLESIILAFSGLAVAWWLGPRTGLIATTVAAGLFVYNVFLKKTPLLGNLLVCLLAASAFPYGAIAAGNLGRSWIPAVFAFLFHLGREIVKDIEDIDGDRREGARTLAVALGPRIASIAASAVYLVLITVTLLPVFLGVYGTVYLILVACLDILILFTFVRLWRNPTRVSGQRSSRTLTAGMALGLIAVIAGELLS